MTEEIRIVGGLVQGPEPEFDGPGTAMADTLDVVVNGGSTTNTSASLTANWQKENMAHLAEQIAPLLSLVGNNYNGNEEGKILNRRTIDILQIQALLPYVLELNRSDREAVSKKVIPITVKQSMPSNLIRSVLEQKYGTELAQTGIYETCGLNNTEVQVEQLIPFFNEMEELQSMNGKYIPFKDNAYLSLLAYPVEVRPFFSGAIKDECRVVGTDNVVRDFVHPLSLLEILKYAKKVGEVPKVAEYMKIMNTLKEQ
ncbi:hypothetical protein HYU21_00065 [Candidatus Woesearchaeota archaeon]|nr:hypothetical protein [Candidatus Woesearchaeota archaeon]